MENQQSTLNPSEAVYGFASWLTTRSEVTTMSSKHDSSVIAQLVERFCKENNLPPVSDQWPKSLVHPAGEVALLEEPPKKACFSETGRNLVNK